MSNTESRTTEQDIERLDREAREALDRLAQKREELAKQHQATELAEERRREREEERRSKDEEKRREKARKEAEKLGEERLALEERAEEEATALLATLQELKSFDIEHRRAWAAVEGNAPQKVFSDFPRELSAWFRGRFNAGFEGAVPGIGTDPFEGKSLPERDPLTPEASPKVAKDSEAVG